MKQQHAEREKIFANYMTDKGLTSKVHKTAHITQYQMNNLIKNWTEVLLLSFYWTTQSYLTLSIPWTAACKASLSFIIFLNLFRLLYWVSDVMEPSHSLPSPFLSCPQSFPASGSFPMSQVFLSGGQSIGASASVFPMNIQGLFPSGLTALISLLSKEFLIVFSNTTVRKHQIFSFQPSLWSNSNIRTWLLEKP